MVSAVTFDYWNTLLAQQAQSFAELFDRRLMLNVVAGGDPGELTQPVDESRGDHHQVAPPGEEALGRGQAA